jgi:amidophosphoribosyltransferase
MNIESDQQYIYVNIPTSEMDKPAQTGCGIVALYNPDDTDEQYSNIRATIIAGAGVQHRGQQGAGIAFYNNDHFTSYERSGLLNDVFSHTLEFIGDEEPFTLDNPTKIVLLHTRYGTEGAYRSYNLQPCCVGEIAVVHNGNLVALDTLRQKVRAQLPDDVSDTVLFTHFLAEMEGNSWEEKILNALKQVNGAYSTVIAASGKLYLARDQFGLRPFVLAKYKNGWIAASETTAFREIHVNTVREIRRGEVVRIDENGLTTIKEGLLGAGNRCDFEKSYYSRPDALFPIFEHPDDGDYPDRWRSIERFRELSGEYLAREEEKDPPDVDFVVGIPDSGMAFAAGYANARQLPLKPYIIRTHYSVNGLQRSFQSDEDPTKRKETILTRLAFVADRTLWEGMNIVVGDDSLVRSFVIRTLNEVIRGLGVKKVHLRVNQPPISFTCPLGVNMKTEEELIAHRFHGDLEAIARDIGLDSVRYLSSVGFNRVQEKMGDLHITIPKNIEEIFLANGGCGGCVTGNYPINRDGVIYQLKG